MNDQGSFEISISIARTDYSPENLNIKRAQIWAEAQLKNQEKIGEYHFQDRYYKFKFAHYRH